jgi:hypothetical protein
VGVTIPGKEVTATGSRIHQEIGMTSAVPVTSLEPDALKAMNAGASLVDQLDKHPMVIPNYNTRNGSQNVSNSFDAYGRRYELGFNIRF